MRTIGKWLGRILLMLILAAAVMYVWKREEIHRLMAVNSLFSEDKIVHNFSNMNQAFLTRDVARGDGPVSALPSGPNADMPSGFADWVEQRSVTGVVVLKDGQMVHETYYQGTSPEDQRISWSVAKSYLSALFGVVLAEGHIESLDDPVTKYAPSLAGTAYDAATIRNVLQMSSGVTFDEDYLDFNSDINRMGRVIALGGTMDSFAEGLSETFIAPGTQWKYVSIDTHILGMVIRGATGRDIASLLSEKIIQPLGYEASPYYITDGVGVAFVLGGLNIRTRDYARFGQMFLQNGKYGGQQIVPADWVAASTVPSAKTAEGKLHYGYQWWMPKDVRDGEFFGIGVYGQYVYINRPLGIVIAVNSADRQFKQDGVSDSNIAMLRQISESLQ
ncbi:serine hydrolase domain-containing protein [Shimia thalassica]|uniref:serine hydrolase domain-containing protein n=1 Tax=Shimia thalassica TaxID=1715693 RepID=UPI0026E2B4D4|nr:serine hydrolase [Shimia thalassica]MDO6479197.1 serine hydrolase [Shimia thalassica]